MKITLTGSGHVVTGACLAGLGTSVVCLDRDARKIELLNVGGVPIHEPVGIGHFAIGRNAPAAHAA